jgi:hypothetical protein
MARTNELPCLQFVAPYFELLLRGKLIIGDCAVKTRNNTWGYRGPVLFRTSGGKPAQTVLEGHGLTIHDAPQGIVGYGELIDTRELSNAEIDQWAIQVNNISISKLRRLRCNYAPHIEPCLYGYFFKNVRRFLTPVAWKPMPGPVNPVYVPNSVVCYAMMASEVAV